MVKHDRNCYICGSFNVRTRYTDPVPLCESCAELYNINMIQPDPKPTPIDPPATPKYYNIDDIILDLEDPTS